MSKINYESPQVLVIELEIEGTVLSVSGSANNINDGGLAW